MKNSNVLSIIVTYNALRNDWIRRCLTSLNQSQKKTDIIVIDNASSDGTVEFIKESFAEVELIESDVNLGFGRANNLGLEKCFLENYDFAFLLNQDAWITEDTLTRLLDVSLGNTSYGIISPIHLNGIGDALDYNFSLHISPPNCKNLYSDLFLKKTIDAIYPIKFTNAAAWLITKKCIDTVGGFNPSFFHYGEDDNYIHRLVHHGLMVGVVPLAYIYHDREDRVKNNFFNEFNSFKREVLLLSSHPNNNFSFQK